MIVTLPNGVRLDLTLEVINQWNGGFITRVSVENLSTTPLVDWSIGLDLDAGITVANSNQATVSQTGTEVELAPFRPWLTTVSPGETASFTFRSTGTLTDAASQLGFDSLTTGGVTYPFDAPPPGGSIDTALIVKDTWPTGAWLQVTISNFTDEAVTDWRLPIDIPAGLSFKSSGSVEIVVEDGQTFLVPKRANIESIAAGDTIVLGFNVEGDPALVSGITKGALTGATPPAAVNETITAYDFDTATGTLSFDVADLLVNDSSRDGSAVEVTAIRTLAGGGETFLTGSTVNYEALASETGRIALEYTVTDGAGLSSTAQAFIDLPEAPELIVGDITVDESAGTATFEVTLTGALALSDEVSVDFATRERSALAGIDFVAQSGTLTFTEGSRVQTVVVPLVNDNREELTETFDLVLSNALGARIPGDAAEATILDDASDFGPLGDTTPGLDISVALAGEFVVGYTAALTITNNTGATLTGSPLVTVGVQDGMKLVTQTGDYTQIPGGSGVTQDGQAFVVASHDDRYFTLAVNPTFKPVEGINPDLADGTWDAGDTATIELFFRGAHFFKPIDERIEVDPVLIAETPERPFEPLDLTYKGFNTTFFNRSDVTDANIEASFLEQQALGANSVAIVTTHFMDNKDATEVKATDFTMTDADLVDAIREARDDGLSVLLKPHIDLESGQFRGRLLNTAGTAKVEEFFGRQDDGSYAEGSYGELITRYAGIAEAEGVPVMLIGTELVDLAKSRANLPYWQQLIEDVRDIYSGDLSYATIVGEELFVRFWDELDYISLDIYPPLTDSAAPSVGELVDGWTELPTTERGLEAYFNQPITDLIAGLSEQFGKKVLITETGFRSVDGIASRPFDFELTGFADLQEQQDAYESFFIAAMEDMGAYLDGVFLWEYPNQPAAEDGTIERAFGYTPQNKPVIDLIEDFFAFA